MAQIKKILLKFYLPGQYLLLSALCMPSSARAAINESMYLELPINNFFLIIALVLLCLWLTYRLLHARLQQLNSQITDFHALADNAHDGIFIIQNGFLVFANQRAAEILSYTTDELITLQLVDVIHPDEAETVLDLHRRRLRGEDVAKQYEANFLNKHGNKVPVELTAAITSWHSNSASLIIIRDITDRKLIQQTLIDSEKRYRSLVENSPDAIVILDVDSGHIIEANEQTCLMFNLSKAELYETSLDDLSASRLGTINQKAIGNYIERALHGMPLIFEHTFTKSDDSFLVCEVRLTRMPFPRRKLIRASITDVSERKLYQTAVRESEARLSCFFEASFEVLLFHENGIITDVNNQAEDLFGYQRNDVIGHNVLDYVAPESKELAQHNMLKGINDPYEIMAIHKNGRIFPVQIHARTLQQDGRTQRIVSIIDISQLKETHRELLESRQNLQSIIDNMLDTYYRTDANGILTMVSTSVEEMLGYKPEDVIGTTMASYYADPYERQFFLDNLKNNNGVVRAYESAIRHKNGTIRWVATHARYLYDEHGDVTGVEGISRDITEQRNYQLALNQANTELEIKVDRRTRQLQDKITELENIQLALTTSEENFRILVENAVDVFLLHDLKGRIIDVNQFACKKLGYSRDELLNMNISDIDIGSNPVSFKNIVEKLKTQDNFQIESVHLHKDGHQIPVEINIGVLTRRRKKLILALARDISHREPVNSTAEVTPQESIELA